MQANLYALGAIALWATLASLGIALRHVPPFLLTGLALVIGSVPAWPLARRWKVAPSTLALGIYGLFGYHFLLFIALRHAPPVEANLVNYLWPLLIVVLAPLILPGMRLRAAHAVAAVAGFAGAAIAILGAGGPAAGGWSWGYLPALGSAFIWASYSLLTRRVEAFPTAAIGLFGLVSGLLSLLCHALLEPPAALAASGLGTDRGHGAGPAGRGLLPVGQGAQAGRSAPGRNPQLHHAAGFDGAAHAGERARIQLEHPGSGAPDHRRRRAGHAHRPQRRGLGACS